MRDARVLDCFTHTGSFALHAGHYGAREVTGVDISEYACQFATENARLNGLEDRVHFQEANAFDLLAEQSRHGEKVRRDYPGPAALYQDPRCCGQRRSRL